MAVLRGAVGRADAEDCFQETFIAALRAYPKLERREQPARLAADDRPPQGDRPPPRQRAPAGAGRRGCRGRGQRPGARRRDLGAGRGAAAEAAGGGRAALRLRPAPCRDRRGARLLAGGGAPQPARGSEATERGRWHERQRCERFAERAAAEGLLDVAYATDRLALRAAAAGEHASAACVRVGLPNQDAEELLEELATGSRRGCSRRPPGSTRRGASSTSTSRAARSDFELPLDWQLSTASARRVQRAIAAIPYGQTRSYTEIAPQRRKRARGAGRGHGLRLQPDPDRRPLPPGAAQRRRPRRLRRAACR